MDGSPLAVPQQQPQFGTSMPVAGAVHNINSGRQTESPWLSASRFRLSSLLGGLRPARASPSQISVGPVRVSSSLVVATLGDTRDQSLREARMGILWTKSLT